MKRFIQYAAVATGCVLMICAVAALVHPVAASLLALAYIFAFVAAGVYND